jgi:hypothetical protein
MPRIKVTEVTSPLQYDRPVANRISGKLRLFLQTEAVIDDDIVITKEIFTPLKYQQIPDVEIYGIVGKYYVLALRNDFQQRRQFVF